MKTPALPPNHELLPPDFLRQHGAVKDLQVSIPEYLENGWLPSAYKLGDKIRENDFRIKAIWCAPLGTIAAATTPVPEGRCTCLCGYKVPHPQKPEDHPETCPAHPRNAYVHILPHQLAQLSEKPEGLISRRRADKFPEDAWSESTRFWPNNRPFHPDYVYAVPCHVLDRIEQQLSTKGGDEPCPQCSPSQSEGSNAAPESSDPTGEAAHVCELMMCESVKLGLRPGLLYRFSVDLNCTDCVRIANDNRLPEDPEYIVARKESRP